MYIKEQTHGTHEVSLYTKEQTQCVSNKSVISFLRTCKHPFLVTFLSIKDKKKPMLMTFLCSLRAKHTAPLTFHYSSLETKRMYATHDISQFIIRYRTHVADDNFLLVTWRHTISTHSLVSFAPVNVCILFQR